MLAARNGRVEVGKVLIERFPRCIPWTNKQGLDAVRGSLLYSIAFTPDSLITTARAIVPQSCLNITHTTNALPPRIPRFALQP